MIIPARHFGHYGFEGQSRMRDMGFGFLGVVCPAPAILKSKCCLDASVSATGRMECCKPGQDAIIKVAGNNKYKISCAAAGTQPPPPPPPPPPDPTQDGSGGTITPGGTYLSTGGGSSDGGGSDIAGSLVDFLTTGYTPVIIAGLVALWIFSSSKKPAAGGGSAITIAPAPAAPAAAAK